MNTVQAMTQHPNTKETTPWHIFGHDATLLAIRMGASAEHIDRARLLAWYQAGESVGMVAAGLRDLDRGRQLARREEGDRAIIHAAHVNARRF